MGMSDVTCAVSHLPIKHGEPCRMIFLRQQIAWDDQLTNGTWEHVWAKWVPMSLPIKGVYDGYADLVKEVPEKGPDVPLDVTPVLKFQVESIARVALDLPPDEPRSGFADLEHFPNSIESLMFACERGWLRVKLPLGRLKDDEEPKHRTLRVSPYYVSERAWQAMIASSEDRGIGTWRGRLQRHHENSRDMARGLRMAVDHYRDLPERCERMTKALEGTEMEDDAEDLLDRIMPHMFRDLTPEHEMSPDVLVVGGDGEPDVRVYKTLFEFGEADWKELGDLVFDFKVFCGTLRHELRREIHPELYRDQFYYPHQGLEAPRMLRRYIDEWCLEIAAEYPDEEDEGD